MSSGRANVGVQQRGGRAGGFFGARRGGGGGGGGRRPWESGDGPMGHRWEDTRREGRIEKNRASGRGQGRGRGGTNVGRGMANENTREKRHQSDRLMLSQATQYEAADVESGVFLGVNLDARSVNALMARVDSSQPEGTRYDVQIKVVSGEEADFISEAVRERFLGSMVGNTTQPEGTSRNVPAQAVSMEDGPASSEIIKGRFLSVPEGDPFAFDPDQEGMEMEVPHASFSKEKGPPAAEAIEESSWVPTIGHNKQPQRKHRTMRTKAVKPERGLVSSEAAKQQLYGAMLSTADPFAFDPDQKDEVPKGDDMEVDDKRRG